MDQRHNYYSCKYSKYSPPAVCRWKNHYSNLETSLWNDAFYCILAMIHRICSFLRYAFCRHNIDTIVFIYFINLLVKSEVIFERWN